MLLFWPLNKLSTPDEPRRSRDDANQKKTEKKRTNHFVSKLDESVAQVRAQKTGSTSDENAHDTSSDGALILHHLRLHV